MKFRLNLVYILPAVLLVLAGCGSKEGELADAPPANNSLTPNSSTTGGGTLPPPQGGGEESGDDCNPQAVGPVLSNEVVGTGDVTRTAITLVDGVDPLPDQKLRVRIIPGPAGGTDGAGGSHNYYKLSTRVKLYKGATLLRTVTIPNQSGGGTYGPSKGLSVGEASEVIDFSAYLTSAPGNYYIKVSDVETDYVCNTYCPAYYYWPECYYGGDCQEYLQCLNLQCDVGPVLDTSTWSVTVEAETDFTQCF